MGRPRDHEQELDVGWMLEPRTAWFEKAGIKDREWYRG